MPHDAQSRREVEDKIRRDQPCEKRSHGPAPKPAPSRRLPPPRADPGDPGCAQNRKAGQGLVVVARSVQPRSDPIERIDQKQPDEDAESKPCPSYPSQRNQPGREEDPREVRPAEQVVNAGPQAEAGVAVSQSKIVAGLGHTDPRSETQAIVRPPECVQVQPGIPGEGPLPDRKKGSDRHGHARDFQYTLALRGTAVDEQP